MPTLLDAFCGAGGAAMGYHRAGFTVTGVDNRPQPRYPFAFILGDALEYIAAHGHEYDVIHASPPCQGYSIMRNLPWLRDKVYPLLIEPTRELLSATGRPWVIENVMGAKLPAGWLCGQMFGLPFFRHRYFEAGGWYWLQMPHTTHTMRIRGSHTLGGRARSIVASERRVASSRPSAWATTTLDSTALGKSSVSARAAMGVDWMTTLESGQAIPPAYTEWIGRQLMPWATTHDPAPPASPRERGETSGGAGGRRVDGCVLVLWTTGHVERR